MEIWTRIGEKKKLTGQFTRNIIYTLPKIGHVKYKKVISENILIHIISFLVLAQTML